MRVPWQELNVAENRIKMLDAELGKVPNLRKVSRFAVRVAVCCSVLQ